MRLSHLILILVGSLGLGVFADAAEDAQCRWVATTNAEDAVAIDADCALLSREHIIFAADAEIVPGQIVNFEADGELLEPRTVYDTRQVFGQCTLQVGILDSELPEGISLPEVEVVHAHELVGRGTNLATRLVRSTMSTLTLERNLQESIREMEERVAARKAALAARPRLLTASARTVALPVSPSESLEQGLADRWNELVASNRLCFAGIQVGDTSVWTSVFVPTGLAPVNDALNLFHRPELVASDNPWGLQRFLVRPGKNGYVNETPRDSENDASLFLRLADETDTDHDGRTDAEEAYVYHSDASVFDYGDRIAIPAGCTEGPDVVSVLATASEYDNKVGTWGFTNRFTPSVTGTYRLDCRADDTLTVTVGSITASSHWQKGPGVIPGSATGCLTGGVSYAVSGTYYNAGSYGYYSYSLTCISTNAVSTNCQHRIVVSPDYYEINDIETADFLTTYPHTVRVESTCDQGCAVSVVTNPPSDHVYSYTLMVNGSNAGSGSCTYSFGKPKDKTDKPCSCCNEGTDTGCGSVYFAQKFGRTPALDWIPAGRVVVEEFRRTSDLGTTKVLRYDHPICREIVWYRGYDALIRDGLGNCYEYRDGRPVDTSAGLGTWLYYDGTNYIERLSDDLEVVYGSTKVVALRNRYSRKIPVSELGIAVERNDDGSIALIRSTADGEMSAQALSDTSWRLEWNTWSGAMVKRFDFALASPGVFTLHEYRNEEFQFNYQWTYDESANDWLYERLGVGTSLVSEKKSVVFDANAGKWQVHHLVLNGDGSTARDEFSELDVASGATRTVGKSVGSDVTYSATRDASGFVDAESDALGCETSYERDALGRVFRSSTSYADGLVETTENRYPFGMERGPDDRPISVVTRIGGIAVSHEVFAYDTNRIDRTRYSGGCARSSFRLFDASGRECLSVSENGRAVSNTVEVADNGSFVRTSTEGLFADGFVPVEGRSTRSVEYCDVRGNATNRTEQAYVSGTWKTIGATEMRYDAAHRVVHTALPDGRTSSSEWICTGPVWTRDGDGIVTSNRYDAAKRKIASTRYGPFGARTTSYEYDASGNVIRETVSTNGVAAQVTTRSYDDRNRLVRETSPDGGVTTWSWSDHDRVETVTYPDGGTRITTSNPDGTPASVTGTSVTPEYHTYGVTDDGLRWHCVRHGRADSPRFETTYADGFDETVRLERSGFGGAVLVTENEYDGRGRLVRVTSTGEPTRIYEYDDWGDVTSVTESADGVERYQDRSSYIAEEDGVLWRCDEQAVSCSDESIAPQHTTQATRLSGLTLANVAESFSVDVRGNTNRTWSALDPTCAARTTYAAQAGVGNVSLFEITDGQQTMTVDSWAVTNRASCNELGFAVVKTDGRGNATTYAYDAVGRVVRATDAIGSVTTYGYDKMGNVTAITNALGNVITRNYDTRGKITYEGGATYPVRYAYDLYGNRISMTTYRDESSGSGDATTWLYDEASGCMTNKVYADGMGPTYAYDANGRLVRRTWARGVTTDYSYDGWGNPTNTVYSDDTPCVSLTYDALGRKVSVVDAAGTTSFAYDDYGSLTNETWAGLGNRTLTRHWDACGRTVGYSVNDVRKTTLGYDAATGRLVTMNEGGNFTWQYLPGSDLKSRVTYPNGVMVDYSYEPQRDLLTGVTNHLGDTVYSSYAYENDALGRRTARNDEQYGYNTRNELTSATGSGAYSYEYDDIGNRLASTEPSNSLSYVANQLNQYASVSNVVGGAFTPAYDADGNQTLVKTSTGIWSVTYNGENRPICWSNGTTVVTMDFDSMGRRTFYRETINGVQTTFTRFFYDGYLMIQQLYSNAPYNVYKEFVWDPTEPIATKPLCFRQDGQTATFLTHDGNKNVTDVIRVSPYNDSVGHYDYAPFGAVRSQIGSYASANPIRFSSEFADATLSLVYYNYRHYHALNGRWCSFDLMVNSEESNLYGFVGNHVMQECDSLGLRSVKSIQCIVGAKTDGIFGPGTANKIREYQNLLINAGLLDPPADGSWGPSTEAAHQKAIGKVLAIKATLTYYCACKKCCGTDAKGIAADGTKFKEGIVAAPSSIPFGSTITYEINGQTFTQTVHDRGSRITVPTAEICRFDIGKEDHDECRKCGVQEKLDVKLTLNPHMGRNKKKCDEM